MRTKTRELNSRQHLFVINLLSGMSQTDAYIKAGYNVARGVAETNAAALIRNPIVSSFYDAKRDKAMAAVESQVLSKAEKRQILAGIARVSLADHLDDDGNIKLNRAKAKALKEYYKRTHTDQNGNPISTSSIKLIDVISAIQEDNKMMGDYAPQKHLIAEKVIFEVRPYRRKKEGLEV